MKQQHVHKYIRTVLGYKTRIKSNPGYPIYKCTLQNCSHYLPEALITGRLCICWRCGRDFEITLREAKLKKPHCKECTYTPINEIMGKVEI